MKRELVYWRFRIERRLALMPWRRAAAAGFWVAGSAACFSSGLGIFMDATPGSCFLSMIVGIAYNGIGAMLWSLE